VADFPATIFELDDFVPSETLDQAHGGYGHVESHNAFVDEIAAAQTKLGTGASTPSAGTVLRGTGSGTSAFGAVQTGDMAANAATQSGSAVGSTSGPSTTSTTYVDIPEMSVTLTTTGGDLIAWFSGVFYNSVASNVTYAALSLDGASEVAQRYVAPSGAAEQIPIATIYRFAAPAAGSHTVKARWKVSAGTGNTPGLLRELVVMELKR
jgi:hypothetical protein